MRVPCLDSVIRGALLACVAGCGPAPSSDDVTPEIRWTEGFAERVVDFSPGETAGFGSDRLPQVVLGPPDGRGVASGSLDVVSLGREGSITLAFDTVQLFDGPGHDLVVFENPFRGFSETGIVSVSADGVEWREFPCLISDDAPPVGCAGVAPVLASGMDDLSPFDPSFGGGDAFDLADLDLESVRFVRIRDSGRNLYGGTTGGFDLDAVAAIHRRPR